MARIARNRPMGLNAGAGTGLTAVSVDDWLLPESGSAVVELELA